jgi:hypothetical protein
MRMKGVGLMVVLLAVAGAAQEPGMETAKDMFAKLTPEEQQRYQMATKDFQASHYAEALPVYKTLLAAHAGDSFLAKMVSESAVNTGDLKLAKDVIEPVVKADEDDWQASGLMLRVAAQLGDKAGRDAGFEHMLDLYKRGLTPKGFTQYIVEKTPAGDKSVLIFKSLVPWGNYKTYYYARVFDASGQMVSRITVESADFDQTLWAKSHPKEAAAGGRMFSVDGYSQGPANAAGQHTETHATYGFLDAEPTYDEVRAKFIGIASGKGGMLSRTDKTVQAPAPPPQPPK